jgi:hypothetical protein
MSDQITIFIDEKQNQNDPYLEFPPHDVDMLDSDKEIMVLGRIFDDDNSVFWIPYTDEMLKSDSARFTNHFITYNNSTRTITIDP